jgi:hypothetical protein
MTQQQLSAQAMPSDLTIEWAPFMVADGVDEARHFTLMQGADHTEPGVGVLHFQRVRINHRHREHRGPTERVHVLNHSLCPLGALWHVRKS